MFQDFRFEAHARALPGDAATAMNAPAVLDAAAAPLTAVANSRIKRVMDVLGSLALLVALAPLLLLVAAVIKLESRGPIIFKQRRTGLGGQIFHIYKFRTMRVCEDGASIKQVVAQDPRITRFGGLLRRSSVDELPQLINVLRGDMSLIGPRPHALAHDDHYRVLLPNYPKRFAARPGITGLAQVRSLRGPTPTTRCMAIRVAADLEYIAGWSLRTDLWILIRSAVIVFSGSGR